MVPCARIAAPGHHPQGSRLALEAHHEVFLFVLKLLTEAKLIKGKRLGIDASTMEANTALKTIVRRDTGEDYEAMLKRLASESGIATPTKADLIRFDRKRKGKTLSNKDWESPVDPDSHIAKLKRARLQSATGENCKDYALNVLNEASPMALTAEECDERIFAGPKT